MAWRRTAPHLIAIAAAAAACLVLLLTEAAAAQSCWVGVGVGFGVHSSNANASWPAAVGQSGYDPFVLDHHSGRFRYVPIPYDPEPRGSGYSPYRLNWHSGNFDYVPVPTEQDYARWHAAARDEARRVNGVAAIGAGAGAGGFMGAAQPVPPNAVLATDLSGMRGTEGTAVSREVSVAPPPPPPRLTPQGFKSATTRPTLAKQPPPAPPTAQNAQTAPAPAAAKQASPSRGAKTSPADAGGWTTMRGVTGRWQYDYQTARWIFLLPSD